MVWANGDWEQVSYDICGLLGLLADSFGEGPSIWLGDLKNDGN